MFDQSQIRALVEPILNASNPAKALREHVLCAGGNWAEANSTDLSRFALLILQVLALGPKKPLRTGLQTLSLT